jgi:hypothetical protein
VVTSDRFEDVVGVLTEIDGFEGSDDLLQAARRVWGRSCDLAPGGTGGTHEGKDARGL